MVTITGKAPKVEDAQLTIWLTALCIEIGAPRPKIDDPAPAGVFIPRNGDTGFGTVMNGQLEDETH